MSSEWIGIVITIVAAAAGILYAHGYNSRRLDEKDEEIKEVREELRSLKFDSLKHNEDDRRHFADTEIHWNRRERDALAHQLEKLSAGIELLLDRANRRRIGDA